MIIMPNMDLMQEIASDAVLGQAYEWLCERRKDYSANSDVWDVRWRWYEIKPRLQEQLLAGIYHFDALRRIRRDNDTLEIWSALDALVLKAMAIVLTKHLAPDLSDASRIWVYVKRWRTWVRSGLKAYCLSPCVVVPSYSVKIVDPFGTVNFDAYANGRFLLGRAWR